MAGLRFSASRGAGWAEVLKAQLSWAVKVARSSVCLSVLAVRWGLRRDYRVFPPGESGAPEVTEAEGEAAEELWAGRFGLGSWHLHLLSVYSH